MDYSNIQNLSTAQKDTILKKALVLLDTLYENEIEDAELQCKKISDALQQKFKNIKKGECTEFTYFDAKQLVFDLYSIENRISGLYSLVENFMNPVKPIVESCGTWKKAWDLLDINNPDVKGEDNKQNAKYQVICNNKPYPKLLSLRKVPKKIFELLIADGFITQENLDFWSEYIRTDKENDKNYQPLEVSNKNFKEKLFIKVQWQKSAIKNLLQKLGKYNVEIIEEQPFPNSCGVYMTCLKDDADLSIFGKNSQYITENICDNVIYIGSSSNINKRINNAHLYSARTSALRRNIAELLYMEFSEVNGKKTLKLADENIITGWLQKNCYFKCETTSDIGEAKEKEFKLIRKYKPCFNKQK